MEHKIWNREMECADRETKSAIQLDRLKKTVETCYNKVPFYKKKFDEIGLRPEHIKTLADVKHIPVHDGGRSQKQLSLWALCSAEERRSQDPRFIGNHRQAKDRRLYEK